jgi:hypothetical protein
MKRVFLVIFLCFLAGNVVADDVTRCRVIHKTDGRVYTVRATLHKAAHIILPEPILGRPINGNVDLWQVEGQNNHLFIKPTTKMKDGAETTVTVIGISNQSYDFRAVRSATPDYCIEIKNDGTLIHGNALSQWQAPQQRNNDRLRMEVGQLRNELAGERERTKAQIENAMLEYRGHIYTRYQWGKGNGFMGKSVISDVWDDGRWSYIRVASDNKGLLTVAGLLDGKKELIEYQYDRENMIYKIIGIYPKLFLRYGNSKITVTRGDEQTAGAF